MYEQFTATLHLTHLIRSHCHLRQHINILLVDSSFRSQLFGVIRLLNCSTRATSTKSILYHFNVSCMPGI